MISGRLKKERTFELDSDYKLHSDVRIKNILDQKEREGGDSVSKVRSMKVEELETETNL